MKQGIVCVLFLITLLQSCAKDNRISNDTIVGVVPYKGISPQKVTLLKKAIENYYDVTVTLLPQQKLPKAAFINIKSPRYRADSLIAIQHRNSHHEVDYVIGLTESDISVTKHDKSGAVKKPTWRYNDFGVMGLAYCPGKSCVVSGFRLKTKNKPLHLARFKKVVIHELGHNFGLPHCPNKKCVMTDAVESIKTIDNANSGLCADCKNKLAID